MSRKHAGNNPSAKVPQAVGQGRTKSAHSGRYAAHVPGLHEAHKRVIKDMKERGMPMQGHRKGKR